jgi:hypothetical protein
MDDEKTAIPDYLYTVHPGGGQCAARELRRENRISATGQYVFRCRCGFQWYLFPSEIARLTQENSSAANV